MKEKQRLCMEESTHRGEDTQRSVHAGEEEYTQKKNYTRRELHTDQYRWWSINMEECTHGKVYTWRSVYMEECIYGGVCPWRNVHIDMEECTVLVWPRSELITQLGIAADSAIFPYGWPCIRVENGVAREY